MSRKLDAAVAEAMGWTHSVVGNYPWQMIRPGETEQVQCVPHFSTDHNAAFQLVEHTTNYWPLYFGMHKGTRGGYYAVSFDELPSGRVAGEAAKDTAPEAICLAFLKAHGVDWREEA